MKRVLGEFSVELSIQQDDCGMGRMLLEKRYFGELEGQAVGQMLSKNTRVAGSASYVAIETFTGTLLGRSGSFSLQHMGIMSKGEQTLTIVVVPDSATGELAGLCGNMQIQLVDTKHYYDFEFEFTQ